MARTDENFRVRFSATWPQIGTEEADTRKAFTKLWDFVRRFLIVQESRDRELAKKINQLHIEYVTAAPADAAAPKDPLPVLRLFYDSGTLYLYAWAEDGWHRVEMTKI